MRSKENVEKKIEKNYKIKSLTFGRSQSLNLHNRLAYTTFCIEKFAIYLPQNCCKTQKWKEKFKKSLMFEFPLPHAT